MRSPKRWFAESFDTSRSWGWPGIGDSLRSLFRSLQQTWFSNGRPLMDKTVVNYDYARTLYRNDGPELNLGAGFCRPIIDLQVEYIGLPRVTSDDDKRDTYLNECIHDFWGPQLLQAWRDALRDSKSVIRFRQPLPNNPLFTDRDRLHGKIECVPPESVEIIWSPIDPDFMEKAIFTHWIDVEDEEATPEPNANNATQVAKPKVQEHQIIEIVTPERYRFFDVTDNRELVSWGGPNTYGFIPLWPCYNEYDVALGGGQSDLEPIVPFVKAFHEVLLQTLQAHKYHSTPKLKFKLKDIGTFLKNNFPTVLDDNGDIVPGAKIQWSGREVIFLQSEEDIEFIEAESVLGDSKTLLEFLIECICIAAETPKWAIMNSENVSDKNAEARPFEKKIERKRVNFSLPVVMLCKMALKATGERPETMRVMWPAIRLDDLVSKGQAIQQIIMGFDVASQHRWVADSTVVAILGSLFPELQTPEVEMAEAASNYEPPIPAQSPASDTQALPAGNKNGSKGSNGTGSKGAAKRALATTSASRS